MAEQRPHVFVFEDLHWADDKLLDFVDYMVDWATGVPILIVATSRPELLERRPAWGGGKLNATTGARPAEAYTRFRAAAELVDAGRRAEADAQLRRALAFWRSVGAVRYVREGDALLAATA
jgi:predicted ATPase